LAARARRASSSWGGSGLVSSRIEAVLPSGRGRRVLGTCPAGVRCFDSAPAWSRRGGRLAFVSRWEGDSGESPDRIALVRSDGSGLNRLPALTRGHLAPAWSPDRRWLSFASRATPGLYAVRSDGTGLRSIVQEAQAWSAWSSKGTIAFSADTPSAASPQTGSLSASPDLHGQAGWFGSETDHPPSLVRLGVPGLVAPRHQAGLPVAHRSRHRHLRHRRGWPRAPPGHLPRWQRGGLVAGRQVHRFHSQPRSLRRPVERAGAAAGRGRSRRRP
jgi:WD40-like Beta Propeller Repeat